MKNIAVYCGSSSGDNTIFAHQAYALGRCLAEKEWGLVYGGADSGLMGKVADGALSVGGKVIGVIPSFFHDREIAHKGITELIVVDSMHERKEKMSDLSQGFIALPGGFGTMEEIFEILSWSQIGLHNKPIGLLNTEGFYDALIAQLDEMVDRGFLNRKNRDKLSVHKDIEPLLDLMFYHCAG